MKTVPSRKSEILLNHHSHSTTQPTAKVGYSSLFMCLYVCPGDPDRIFWPRPFKIWMITPFGDPQKGYFYFLEKVIFLENISKKTIKIPIFWQNRAKIWCLFFRFCYWPWSHILAYSHQNWYEYYTLGPSKSFFSIFGKSHFL